MGKNLPNRACFESEIRRCPWCAFGRRRRGPILRLGFPVSIRFGRLLPPFGAQCSRRLHPELQVFLPHRCLLPGFAAFSLVAFLAFRLHDGLPRYFSGHDVLDVLKAVACALLLTYVVLFSFNRLEGIPRAAPAVHALLLAGGLIVARVLARAFDRNSGPVVARNTVARENIIMIGANPLSSLYIKLLHTAWPSRYNVLAVLDDRPQSAGRTMAGINILAGTNHLESVIDEFAVHGIETGRVIVGSEEFGLGDDALKSMRGVCARRKIRLHFVPNLLAFGGFPAHLNRTGPPTDHRAQLQGAALFRSEAAD